MAEIAPAGGGPNRLFILIALGLAALLILGILGLGGYVFLSNMSRASLPPPTVRIAAASPSPAPVTDTPAATQTSAPTEVATPTLVVSQVQSTSFTPTAAAFATATLTATEMSTNELPKSGMGDDLLLLSGGFVLVLVIFGARLARLTGKA